MTEGEGHRSDVLRHVRVGNGRLLWPAAHEQPLAEWCEPPASGDARSAGTGRGATLRFEAGGRTLVLRRYRRGGLARRLGDRYLRLGLRHSRPWRELALLAVMHARGLPVPCPVAARVEPVGPWSPFCRALLLTEYLPGTRTLTEVLRAGPMAPDTWRRVGALIAEFHAAGIDHADLNAHNILLGEDGGLYLIDFDRGRLRRAPGRWRERNLARLRRSLDKLAGQGPAIAFSETDWAELERGYRVRTSSGSSASE